MIISIYKPKGPSSFAIIESLRQITGEKKIGHAGTLDPLAEGVLIVGIGRESTRKLFEMERKEKEYLADIKLGFTSETDDSEGPIVKIESEKIKLGEIKKSLKGFTGKIGQIPPRYSAIKVKGKRAYKLSRQGKRVELKSRLVEIKKISLISYKYPDLKLRVITGPGVYIRSLARGLGEKLGSGAYLSGLKRTRVGDFNLKKTLTLEQFRDDFERNIIDVLKRGGIGIMPTDTIYGLAGKALNEKTVERIYEVKKRKPEKPFIILIGSLKDLNLFGVKPEKILERYWPGAVSIILPCPGKKFYYLHRGTGSLAFRLPKDEKIIKILKQTGPLAAPSANPEGWEPAKTVYEARKYFNGSVDFYFSSGRLEAKPSTLIKIKDGKVEVLRQGEAMV